MDSNISCLVGATAVVLLSLCALGLFVSRRWSTGDESKRKRRYHPVAGTVLHYLLNYGRLYDFLTDMNRKHQTFRLLGLIHSHVQTAVPANVEYILKTNFNNYGKGEYNSEIFKDLLGDGIFAVDFEKWSHQRKAASLVFSIRSFRDYSSTVFRSIAVRLALVVSKAAQSNNKIDIQDIFLKSTMDSTFQVAFGVELDSLSGSDEEGTKFAESFDDSSALTIRRYADISWKIKRFLKVGFEAVLREKIKVVDDFVYNIIDRKAEHMYTQKHEPLKNNDILSRFLLEREQDPDNMTRKYLRDIILNFLVAGRDTVATTLSWFFYMLSKNPTIQENVFQDVETATKALGHNPSIHHFAMMGMTENALDKMHYLHATLTETLRLYPAIPWEPMMCFSDDTLPDGFDMRKGDIVGFGAYAMGRMEFIWGEDAQVFRPERWLNNQGVFSPQSPFKFTAFKGGPRICLGKEFPYRQMKIFTAVLIHFFLFKLSDEEKSINYKVMLTLQIDQGLHLNVVHR